MKFNKPLYLILGSGGARGLAHIGAIEALEARGIVPDVILGCSMGAVVGAFYAAGWTGPQMRALAAKNSGKALRRLVDPALPMRGLIRGRRIARFLRRNLEAENFNDLPRRFIATALDLQRGRMAIFERGPLVSAIMASIAIPGVFPPLEADGNYYVDGGVVSPIPVQAALERGAGSTIAVDVSPWIESTNENDVSEGEETHAPTAKGGNDEGDDNGGGLGESVSAALTLLPLMNQSGGSQARKSVLERFKETALGWSERAATQLRHWRLEQRLTSSPHIAQTLLRSMMIMQREMGDMHLRLHPPTVLIRPELWGVRAYNFDRMEECMDIGRRAAEAALREWEAK